jgi:hypothetical protein
MYLEEAAIEQTLLTLHRLFPRHKLICDLMTRDFFEKNASTIHEKLTGLGAVFKFAVDNPAEVFLKSGYQEIEKIPIIESAVRLEAPDIPPTVWETLQPTLPQGYDIYVFET